MNPKVTTPPTIASVVSDAELRLHLRIASDGTEDENMAVDRLTAHREAERYTRTAIGSQTRELALDAFPVGGILLPGGKVSSITSIIYTDENGTLQTLSTSVYELDEYSTPARAALKYDQVWPTARCIQNAVKVIYVVGEVLPACKSGIMLLCGFLRENRGDMPAEMPSAIAAVLDAERIGSYS